MTLPMNMTLMTRTDVGPTVRPVDPCWTYVMAASLGCAALLLPEDLPFLCFGGILVWRREETVLLLFVCNF